MGNLFSKKNGFEKQLLDMETKILNLEDKLSNSRIFHQKVLHKIVLYSFAIEFFIILFTYVKSRSLETISDKLFCCIYSILFPLFIFILTKVYGFLYRYLIKKNEVKLDNLKTGLQKKLDERKRETDYENTQKLLDRYEGIINKKKNTNKSPNISGTSSTNSNNNNININNNTSNNTLKNRNTPQLNQPFNIAAQQQQRMSQQQHQQHQHQQQRINQTQTQTQQPILNQSLNKQPSPMYLSQSYNPQSQQQHRNPYTQSQVQSQQKQSSKWWLDKLVDYLISDGPSHGSPLICSNCHSHNGYVPVEELSNIQFRCRVCKSFNQRESPNIENNIDNNINSNSNSSSSSSNNNDNNPVSLDKPSIEEIDSFKNEKETETTTNINNNSNNNNNNNNNKVLENNNEDNDDSNNNSQSGSGTPNSKKSKGKGKGKGK